MELPPLDPRLASCPDVVGCPRSPVLTDMYFHTSWASSWASSPTPRAQPNLAPDKTSMQQTTNSIYLPRLIALTGKCVFRWSAFLYRNSGVAMLTTTVTMANNRAAYRPPASPLIRHVYPTVHSLIRRPEAAHTRPTYSINCEQSAGGVLHAENSEQGGGDGLGMSFPC